MSWTTLRFASGNLLSHYVSSLLRSLARFAASIRRKSGLHVHEWHDWYVFDSAAQTTLGPDPEFRVIGQQIMLLCACGQTQRKRLPTWREARLARKRLPYKPWGVWSFSLAVPEALEGHMIDGR